MHFVEFLLTQVQVFKLLLLLEQQVEVFLLFGHFHVELVQISSEFVLLHIIDILDPFLSLDLSFGHN